MRLHIITTGGAIGEDYFDERSDFQVGDPVIGNLLRDPGVALQFRVESAMRTDAGFNIGCAVGALQCLPPGVYLTMNGRVFDIDNVVKNRAENRFEVLNES